MPSASPTVVARSISKVYSLAPRNPAKLLAFRKRHAKVVRAVNPISFVTYTGESIGILGKNGSGKSTLMRVIAGTESPSSGSLLVAAQPTLLGVSAALQNHLTGLSNVKLGLLAMGLTPKAVSDLVPEVIAWAEVTDAADRPLATYSSGMKARLKFAIATAVKREILIVDEALSTGDAAFAAKAKARMDEFLENAGTVFIVSHGLSTIQRHCSRAIWLHEGNAIADGPVDVVTKQYKMWTDLRADSNLDGEKKLLEQVASEYVSPQIVLDSQVIDHLNGRFEP